MTSKILAKDCKTSATFDDWGLQGTVHASPFEASGPTIPLLVASKDLRRTLLPTRLDRISST